MDNQQSVKWKKNLIIASKILAYCFLLAGVIQLFTHKFPYNLIQIFVIIPATVVIFGKYFLRWMKEFYDWRIFKISKKQLLILVGCMSFILWLWVTPKTPEISFITPFANYLEVESNTVDIEFRVKNANVISLNGERIFVTEGKNKREVELSEGKNSLVLTVTNPITSEVLRAEREVYYLTPEMKKEREFMANYPEPVIEVLSPSYTNSRDISYELRVKSTETVKMYLDGEEIMKNEDDIYIKDISLKSLSTGISLKAVNLHKESIKNIIISRLETLEEKQKQEAKRLEKIEPDIKELKALIKSVPNIDFSLLRQNLTGINILVIQMQNWEKEVLDAELSNYLEIKELGKKLRPIVEKKQSIEFPLLRKAYGNVSDKMLWKSDIDVRVYGNSNGIIEYTGGTFAANRNIEETFRTVEGKLKELRFDQANYKWNEYDDKYTYYTLKSLLDTDIRY